jgi:hypothetical protein
VFGIETLAAPARAVALLGLVFAEAILLHAGYSRLTRIAAPTVKDLFED